MRILYEGTVTDPLSLNWYTYCKNDPVDNVDPSGNMSIPQLRETSFLFSIGFLNKETLTPYVISANGKGIYTAFHEIAQLYIADYLITLGKFPVLEYNIKYSSGGSN